MAEFNVKLKVKISTKLKQGINLVTIQCKLLFCLQIME